MKKIYYLQKIEVELGDLIAYKGFKTTVTEELIELNPELFRVEKNTQPMYFKCVKGEGNYTKGRIYKQKYSTNYPIAISLTNDKGITENVHYWEITYIKHAYNCFELSTKEEWDKQELLDEAKRRYPSGTRYIPFNEHKMVNKEDLPLVVSEIGIPHINHYEFDNTSIWIDSGKYNGVIYTDGKWAEILPLKFTTEDGVDIYGDMKTYLVHHNDRTDIDFSLHTWKGDSINKSYKYFYHKENALAYIEKHKEKTLEDYENILLRTNINSINAREVCWFYNTLKGKEPKLYYTKILQLIADDSNGDWEPDFNNERQKKWFIDTLGVKAHCSVNYGLVYFKTSKLAVKARALLGDKVKYLFN